MEFCFGKSSRLTKKSHFDYLRSGANRAFSGPFNLFYKISNSESSGSRIGISVSKKFGKANKRNRVKRVAREWFRQSEIRDKNIDMLLVFPKKKLDFSNEQIRRHLNKLAKSIKTIEIRES